VLNGLVVVVCLAAIVWVSWQYRRQITGLFGFFRQAKYSLIFLAAAWVLYGTPQIRELLWIRYGTILSDLDPNHTNYFAFFCLFYYKALFSRSTLSLLLVAFCFTALNPDYRRSLWEKSPTVSDASRVSELLGYGLISSAVFLTIVVYNIIAATFPYFPSNKLLAYIAVNVLVLIVPLNLAASVVEIFAPDARTKTSAPRPPPQAGSGLRITGVAVVVPYVLLALGAHLFLVIFLLAAIAIFICGVPLRYLGFDLSSYLNDSILVVNLFLAALLALLAVIRWAGYAAPKELEQAASSGGDRRWPLPAVLVLSALGLALFDLNDNHRIRETGVEQPPYDIEQAFNDWIEARPDRGEFQTYPVYIIAAEGGGIYAAYHAALLLADIQDRVPRFADHVFAISAVSGGSLGASVFSSLMRRSPDGDVGVLEKQTKEVLSQDFLSGLVFATLFYDLPAHLVPCLEHFCPGRVLDRAIALETSFELAWRHAFRDEATRNPFEQSISASWSAKGNAPGLLLNTTEVETGERVIVGPFSLKNIGAPDLQALIDRAPKLDVRLSTAVGLSARFPGLTPAAWYLYARSALQPPIDSDRQECSDSRAASPSSLIMTRCPLVSRDIDQEIEKEHQEAERRVKLSGSVRRRLVDGGYFDNSGVTTALDVISALRNIAGAGSKPTKFILIALTSRQEEGAEDLATRGFGELLSPLRTLDSVRSTRARSAVRQAQVALDKHACVDAGSAGVDGALSGPKWCARVAILDPRGVRLPLGWMLSEQSRKAIEDSVKVEVADEIEQVTRELKQTDQKH
jgi:hypothetical protein